MRFNDGLINNSEYNGLVCDSTMHITCPIDQKQAVKYLISLQNTQLDYKIPVPYKANVFQY